MSRSWYRIDGVRSTGVLWLPAEESHPRRPSLPRPAAADEPGALEQPKRHFTKVSSCPLLGLEYFQEYLDRYSVKEQMRKGLQGLCLYNQGFRGCTILAACSTVSRQTS